MEFLEFPYHHYFDGIIGNNILASLDAIINYKERLLITSNAKIPFFLNNYEEFYYEKSNKNEPLKIFGCELEVRNNFKINTAAHLSNKDVAKINSLLNCFKDVFYQENNKLSFTSEVKHRIITKNDLPIYSKGYRYPEIHREEVEKQINEMLKQGIIVNSSSPYNAPIWVVPKKMDNSQKQKWRIVIDYRKLNDNTIDDKFPMPNIEDLFGKLGNCRYFSTIDLAKGFHQIEVHPDDRCKTAFSTANGHFEFTRMPFGLKNSPSTFQRLMNHILRDFINKICVVYLDDILIFSASLEEHILSLKKVLQRLREKNLKVQIDKCNFAELSTNYLGHIITQGGIKPDPTKIVAIQKIPLPSTQKQIKSFLGLSGYYRKFIKDYAKIAYPLIKCLKKDGKIKKNDPEYIEAFNKLKTLLTSDPILVNPDFQKPFTLTTDASNFALGAVLSQNSHPIAFASRTLNRHETNYSTVEKELLAIVWATKHFHTYLYGRKFLIQTDHKPLVWLNNLKEPNMKLQRWKIKLNDYNFTISYVKGKDNIIADGLSRFPYNNNKDTIIPNKENSFLQFTNEINSRNLNFDVGIRSTDATIHSADEDELDYIPITDKPINLFKNQIYLIVSNKDKYTTKIINKKCQNFIYVTIDSNLLEKMKQCIIDKGLMCVFCEDIQLYLRFQDLYRRYFANNKNLKILKSSIKLIDITDENNKIEIIKKEHVRNNHRGINEVFLELKNIYYFPNMLNAITKFINNCPTCILAKHDRQPPKLFFEITESPHKINDIIHMDIWFPYRNIMYLTTIDKFSKYATIHRLKDRTWISILKAIKERIMYLGKMRKLVSDNEKCITHGLVEQFLNENKIEFHKTTAGNKTGNSDVERLHGTLNEHLRILEADQADDTNDEIDNKIFKIITTYNNTIHSTTKCRPIDFINKEISKEEIESLAKKLETEKNRRTERINRNRNNNTDLHDNIVFNRDIQKNKPKYKKLTKFKADPKYTTDTSNKRLTKYYKKQRKRKYKYQ